MTKGVLSWADMRTAINLNTGFFETSRLTLDSQMRIIAGNWDGAGMSAGNLQYNWGTADRLTELFNHLLNNYPSVVQGAFGADTTRYDEFRNVCLNYTRANKIAWGDTITDYTKPAPDGHALIEPWKTLLGNLMVTPECQAKYFQMMDTYYVPNALDLFKQLSCTSRAALASLFDININRGRFYPCNTLVVDFDAIDANGALTDAEKEAQKVYQINVRGNDTTNAMDASAAAFVPRRMAQANQGGDYYGALYDPETQFDVNQEPAIAEKAGVMSVKLGELDIQNVFLGNTPIQSIYLGATLLSSGEVIPYTTSKVPDTQFRKNTNSYAGVESGTLTIDIGEKIYIDVQNFVASKTYFTLDGGEPNETAALYTSGITFNSGGTFTLKAKTYSVSGVAEATRTLTVEVAGALPVTTISPSAVTQNSFPITVTLSATDATTIYYKIGAGTQQTYTVPFTVTQSDVWATDIPVTYWSVGPGGTEAERTITYNTISAVPAQPVVIATPGNNQIVLDWTAGSHQSTLAYTVYRSTVQGQAGAVLAGTYSMSGTTWTDTTAVNGTTYYYMVQAGNMGQINNSTQVSAKPAGAKTWRYVRYVGHGDQTGITSRLVEIQALEGATNRLLDKLPSAGYPTPNGGAIAVATNGAKLQSSGYPFWWTGEGVPDMFYDMGAEYPIDTINLTGYSTVGDPRQTQFKLYVSNNASTWTLVQDYSANTTVQPVDGFYFNVPQS